MEIDNSEENRKEITKHKYKFAWIIEVKPNFIHFITIKAGLLIKEQVNKLSFKKRFRW